ncbi:MAG: CDGSH iron-sulfur domain-containing protein [bacterium]|nr:CDGSH iron-sulfur domain-containing protein [bacterium]
MTLSFDGRRCIHARFCVLGAPTVFLANVKGPWLHPEAVPVEELTAIAHQCPSGAITYRRKDGGPDERPPAVNLIRIREDGPLAVHAQIALRHTPSDGETETPADAELFRATLCRCGGSKNKPYCDGAHKKIQFCASGEPESMDSDPLEPRNGELEIAPQPDGPLVLSGSVEICAGTGRGVLRTMGARLCRCGGSNNKPFCDGTHTTNGFRAP